LPTGVRKLEEQYDEEESICTQVIRTEICGASGINPGNSIKNLENLSPGSQFNYRTISFTRVPETDVRKLLLH
jgi:hypothetical protein